MQDNQNHQLSASCASTTRTVEQDQRMITDLWGAMMALFGELWTRSFGEIPDESGQWTKTLSGISRVQIAEALDEVRKSGRKWPPAAPEFRAICLNTGKEKHPPLEAAYAELTQYIKSGLKDYSHVSPILYHTINRNLDFYNFKRAEEWKAFKAFEVAYKATLFQIECGEKLVTPPPPETLLPEPEKPKHLSDSKAIKKGEEVFKSLLSMFEDEQKPLTPADISDNERLEKLK